MASDLFTGASRYSSDFSAVIERATATWSLPLRQMQQNRTKSNDEVTALRSVQDKVVSLQATLQAIGESVQRKAFQTTASDSTVLKLSSTDGVAEGAYTLQIASLGAFSTVVSNSSVDTTADNFVAADQTKLTLRIWTHNEQDENAAASLATGERNQPDEGYISAGCSGRNQRTSRRRRPDLDREHRHYVKSEVCLSLQSTKLGMRGIQLSEGAKTDVAAPTLMAVDETSRLDPSLGRMVQYKVNGATVYSDSRSITIAPNLTAEILKADPGKDVTVSVSRGRSPFNLQFKISPTRSTIRLTRSTRTRGGRSASGELACEIRQFDFAQCRVRQCIREQHRLLSGRRSGT